MLELSEKASCDVDRMLKPCTGLPARSTDLMVDDNVTGSLRHGEVNKVTYQKSAKGLGLTWAGEMKLGRDDQHA